jgi:hypothetical protein
MTILQCHVTRYRVRWPISPNVCKVIVFRAVSRLHPWLWCVCGRLIQDAFIRVAERRARPRTAAGGLVYFLQLQDSRFALPLLLLLLLLVSTRNTNPYASLSLPRRRRRDHAHWAEP